MKQGVLYIVATPIGNLGDMSHRAIEVLANVDLIAAEDTRHSRHLLAHYNINVSMQAYHEHNEERQTPLLLEKLQAGLSVALISDAGTPLLSDPGYRLVRGAHEQGIRVSPVPGPCAAIAALSASGLATDRFYFAGFPPAKSSARRTFLKDLEQYTATLIFYESSHRIADCLADMVHSLGGAREVLLARELTKTFETLHKSTLEALPAWLSSDNNRRKGEFVIIVAGAEPKDDGDIDVSLEQVLKVLMQDLPLKQASSLAARITGSRRNHAYKLALSLAGK